jgi:hypothetical protein
LSVLLALELMLTGMGFFIRIPKWKLKPAGVRNEKSENA